MAVKSADQISIVDITDGYSVLLTSEAYTFPGGVSAALAGSTSTQIIAMRGATQVAASVAAGDITAPAGITVTIDNTDPMAPVLNISIATSVTSAGSVVVDVHIGDVTITKTFTFSIAFKGATGDPGATGVSAVTGILSNESVTLAADSSGTVASYTNAKTTMAIFLGITDDSANWTVAATPGAGVTGSISGKTYTVTALTNDTGYVTLTASRTGGGYPSVTKTFTLSKAKAGTAGSNGTTPTSYWMVCPSVIQKSIAGVYTPATITVAGYSQAGAGTPAAYSGRFIIASSTDGSTYTDQYTSSANEASKTYTPAAGIKTLRCRLYLAGGTTTLLDEQIITIVSDGATGNPGADALSLVITSNNGTIFKNTAIATTLTAHVYRAGVELDATAIALLGTIKWYKDGSTTALATTGATLVIASGDVTNKAIYAAQLEG